MSEFPYLKPTAQQRRVTESFLGYDHRMKIPDGAYYDGENLSARSYPMLSTRSRRGTVRELNNPQGLIAKDELGYIEDGSLYFAGLPTPLSGISPGEKQLVSMGAYILVFPDKLYYNTQDPADFGSMEADYSYAGAISYSLCDMNGEPLSRPVLSDTEPASPENGELWLDTSDSTRTLYSYSAATSIWVIVESVYTKIGFGTTGEIPRLFKQFDGVSITGATSGLSGEHIIYALGGDEQTQDYIVVVGLIDGDYVDEQGQIRIERRIPDMDYVCQSQNRLWGCYYGNDGERNINEIYASALGDFKNFRQYLGLSTDSWTASCGSDGQFTGAINYLSTPCFFKENHIHRVSISPIGAHRLGETVCRGVQRGSSRSLCVVGETLYYKSRGEVCVWQGGFPQTISEALGDKLYFDAAAGAVGEVYYISMRDSAGEYSLFSYDTRLGIWHREDRLRLRHIAELDERLYGIDAESGALLCLVGGDGEREERLPFSYETGPLRYYTGDNEYVSRLNLTVQMGENARLDIFLSYDGEGYWHRAGRVELSGAATVTLPIRPRRCEHMRMKIAGEGDVTIHAICRISEQGSDVYAARVLR